MLWCPEYSGNKNVESPFLSLPGEIRQEIYRKVLINEPPEVRFVFDTPGNQLLPAEPFPLKVLQTCRQILEEAFYIYYNDNTFIFNCINDLHDFLKRIGPRRRREICSLAADLSKLVGRRGKAVVRLLKQCVNLKNLHIICLPAWPYTGSLRPSLLHLGTLRGLKEVRLPDNLQRDSDGNMKTVAWGGDILRLRDEMMQPR